VVPNHRQAGFQDPAECWPRSIDDQDCFLGGGDAVNRGVHALQQMRPLKKAMPSAFTQPHHSSYILPLPALSTLLRLQSCESGQSRQYLGRCQAVVAWNHADRRQAAPAPMAAAGDRGRLDRRGDRRARQAVAKAPPIPSRFTPSARAPTAAHLATRLRRARDRVLGRWPGCRVSAGAGGLGRPRASGKVHPAALQSAQGDGRSLSCLYVSAEEFGPAGEAALATAGFRPAAGSRSNLQLLR